MIYVLVTPEEVRTISLKEAQARRWVDVEDRHDWDTMEKAERIASGLNVYAEGGETYMAIDNGACVSPRFDVIVAPKVGDDVSYGFNGDCTPCGQIKSISKGEMRVITTTDGTKFYRNKLSGRWVNNGTWVLVRGHISERNPHF